MTCTVLPAVWHCTGTSLSYLLNAVAGLPWQLLYLELLSDLCGTYVSYYLALYSFVTDISTVSSRTRRLAAVDGLDYVSTRWE